MSVSHLVLVHADCDNVVSLVCLSLVLAHADCADDMSLLCFFLLILTVLIMRLFSVSNRVLAHVDCANNVSLLSL